MQALASTGKLTATVGAVEMAARRLRCRDSGERNIVASLGINTVGVGDFGEAACLRSERLQSQDSSGVGDRKEATLARLKTAPQQCHICCLRGCRVSELEPAVNFGG